MPTPTHVFGFAATPLRPIEEVSIANARLSNVEVNVLRWELRDFAVEKLKPSDGWFVSYRVKDSSGSQDLLQHKSPLFIASPIPGLSSGGSKQGDGVTSPKWCKSDRQWPVIGKERAHFVGQFRYGDTVAYLFVFMRDGQRTYVLSQHDTSEQDIEEHYRDEEKGG